MFSCSPTLGVTGGGQGPHFVTSVNPVRFMPLFYWIYE